jgi:cell division transport system permease protein
LRRDAGARFLPWILGITVYVASLAATVTLEVENEAREWRQKLALEATVELPAPAGESAQERQERLEAAVEQIVDTPGVRKVRLLDQKDIEELLGPWLDEGLQSVIQFPDLAAVTLSPDMAIDGDELARRLAPVSPGAKLDNHAEYSSEAMRFLGGVGTSALWLLALVLTACVGLVGFVAATGLSIHRRVIEVLNLFGADDAYIAKQFQLQALRFGAPGAILGGIAASLTWHFGFAWLGLAGSNAQAQGLSTAPTLILIGVPTVALAGAFLTARLVVIAALRREG